MRKREGSVYRVHVPTCVRNSATSDADFREFFIPPTAFALLTVTTLLPATCTVNIPTIGVITLIVSNSLDQQGQKFQEIPTRDRCCVIFSESNSSQECIKCTRNSFYNAISFSSILPLCAPYLLVTIATLCSNEIL